MKVKREIVTPYLIFIFLIVALSGLFMFFHLLDDYTTVVHEFLGVTFAVFAILHIFVNWKSILNYSHKRLLAVPSVVIIVIATALIIIGKLNGNLERELLVKLIQSPVAYSFKVLQIDYQQAKAILSRYNIQVKSSQESIEQISANNHKSPEELIELILK